MKDAAWKITVEKLLKTEFLMLTMYARNSNMEGSGYKDVLVCLNQSYTLLNNLEVN